MVAAKGLLAVSLAKVLTTLQAQLDAYRERITTAFQAHPDYAVFGALPGAKAVLGPRRLAEFGSVREEYPEVDALLCQAGASPVSYQSGQVKKCRLRRGGHKVRVGGAQIAAADLAATQGLAGQGVRGGAQLGGAQGRQRVGGDTATVIFLALPGDGGRLELTVNDGRTEPYEVGTGYGHIALTVDDMQAEVARLAAAGIIAAPPWGNRGITADSTRDTDLRCVPPPQGCTPERARA